MKVAVCDQVSKKVFVGIDVHKKTYAVCVVEEGRPLRKVTMPAQYQALGAFLNNSYKNREIHSVYEAGFSGFGLHRYLTAIGIDNIVVNPASIPVAANNRVKTDLRDARKMAELHSKDSLEGKIFIPTPQQEVTRTLARTREQLTREKTRISNQIKSKLMQFGYIDHDDDRPMSLKLLKAYENLDLPMELEIAIKSLGAVFRCVREQILKIKTKILALLKQNPVQEAICRSVPGIGPISTQIILTELIDINRFKNIRQLYSFAGLTPREDTSGDREKKGPITKQGSTFLRHCLVEIAWRAIRKDSGLKERYDKLKAKRGGKRAIVAIARQLIGRIRACLRDGQSYKTLETAKA
jgi:transposase